MYWAKDTASKGSIANFIAFLQNKPAYFQLNHTRFFYALFFVGKRPVRQSAGGLDDGSVEEVPRHRRQEVEGDAGTSGALAHQGANVIKLFFFVTDNEA